MNNLNPSVNVNWVPGITLEEMEKHCILAALRFYRGNKTQTAGALDIAIRTLDHKLEKYESDSKRDQDRLESDKLERQRTLDRLRGVDFTKNNALGHIYQPTPENEVGRNSGSGEQTVQNGVEAGPRVHVEPASQNSPQQTMPLPERKEVQSMLPRHAPQSSQRKGR
jgi:hypothetical protein